jgi:hypothetical protein
VAHTCNPSYVGDWDSEYQSLRPARENSSQVPISKIKRAKWSRGVTQVVEHLVCKHKALSSNSNATKQKRQRQKTDCQSWVDW